MSEVEADVTHRALPVRPSVDLPGLAVARLDRLRAAMGAEGLDALLLTTPESVSYATGYVSVGADVFRGWQAAALVTGDVMMLVAPAADIAPAVDAGVPVDQVIPFGRFYFESASPHPVSAAADVHADLPAALRTALRRAGLRDGMRVGVEDRSRNVAVTAAMDAVDTVVEAGPAVAAVRGVKLPAEVELLTYGARLVDSAIDAALAAADEGVTEIEMAGVIGATIATGGGQPRFIVATTGPRTALGDAPTTHRAWRAGELARFDVGCTVDGYWADIGRTAVLGGPDSLQASRYAAILAGQDEQFLRARPGIPAREVFASAVAVVEQSGIRPYRRHHCGHGIGQSVYEAPIIAPAVDTPLAAGMTFCFETPYYEVGWGGMMVEDLVLITSGGMKVLTHGDRNLRVVPV